MEVRDQRVDHVIGRAGHEVELRRGVLTRHDVAAAERIGPVLTALKIARRHGRIGHRRVRVKRAFERAYCGGTDSNHAVPLSLRLMHGVDNLLRHVVALGVHDVLRRVVLLHQTEGIDTDLELDGGKLRTLGLDGGHELGREVQARRGSSGRVLFLHGVDGLVLLGVALVIGNVGRQRHVTGGVNGLVERAWLAGNIATGRLKAHQTATAAIGDKVDDLGRQHHGSPLGRMGATGAILNLSTGLQALTRLDQALPNVAQRVNILTAPEQQRLDHATRAGFATDQAGRHHARLVDDEHIARLDIVDDVAEDAVLDGAAMLQRRSCPGAFAIHHQQAAGVTRLGRSLGNQFLRKVVVKIIGTHRHVGYSLYS